MGNYPLPGLILQLRKRRAFHDVERWLDEQNKKKNALYYMFGFYDYLTLKNVLKWNDLLPECSREDEIIDSEPGYSEKFLLKLISPDLQNDCCDNSEEYFSYISDPDTESMKKRKHILKESLRTSLTLQDRTATAAGPFIVISMLHFSMLALKQACSDNSGLFLNRFLQEQIIKNLVDKHLISKDEMARLNCSTYYTTGFSDMVAVFRTSNLELVSKFISFLRCMTIADGAESGFLLSNSYTVYGINTELEEPDLQNKLVNFHNISMATRMQLKPGISADLLYHNLREALGELKESPLKDRVEAFLPFENSRFFTIYGNSDVMLKIDDPEFMLYGFSKYKGDDGVFTPLNKFFKDNLLFIDTSLRWDMKNVAKTKEDDLDAVVKSSNSRLRKIGKKIKEEILQITGFGGTLYTWVNARNVSTSKMSDSLNSANIDRLVDNVKHTLEIYYDLACHDHSFAIRHMMDPVLNMFSDKLRDMAKDLNALALPKHEDLVRREGSSSDYVYKTIALGDDSIEALNNDLKDLFIDLLRSEKQYVEDYTMIHPAIASTSKFILIYTSILQEFSKIIKKGEPHYDPDNTKHAFFLTSGGVAHTSAKKYFSYLLPKRTGYGPISESSLFQLRLQESTMFSVGPTLYLLFHELWHQMGYRDHDSRAKYHVQMVYKYMLDYFGMLYDRHVYELDKTLENVADTTLKEKLIKSGSDFLRGRRESFKKIMFAALDPSGILEVDPPSFETLLSQFWPKEVNSYIFNDLTYHQKYGDTANDGGEDVSFANEFTKCLRSDLADMYEHVGQEYYHMYSSGQTSSPYPYALDIQGQIHRSSKGVSALVQKYIDIFLDRGMKPFDVNRMETQSNLFVYGLDAISDELMWAFQEVFVELMTIRYLECTPGQFLSVFLYENEIPELAFPIKSPGTVLRFGSVLYLTDEKIRDLMVNRNLDDAGFMTGVKQVTDSYKNEIIQCCNGIKPRANGNKDELLQKTAGQLLELINELLGLFRKNYYLTSIAEPLLNYGRESLDYHDKRIKAIGEEKDSSEFLDSLRVIFNESMKHSTEPGYMASVWKKLLVYWVMPVEEERN